MRSSLRLGLLCAAIAATLALAAHAGPRPLFLGGYGSTVLLAYGNSIYTPSGNDKMQKLVNVARPQVTAMTCGPDGVFAAVGRGLYGGRLDGADMRPMGAPPAEAVTALANFGGVLWSAGGDSLYEGPVAGGGAPRLVARVPGTIGALYASADGLYLCTGTTLWRMKGGERTKVLEAPAPITALTGGAGRVLYAWSGGADAVVGASVGDKRWTLRGVPRVQSMYLDDARHTLHYAWSDDRGPHYGSLAVDAP